MIQEAGIREISMRSCWLAIIMVLLKKNHRMYLCVPDSQKRQLVSIKRQQQS